MGGGYPQADRFRFWKLKFMDLLKPASQWTWWDRILVKLRVKKPLPILWMGNIGWKHTNSLVIDDVDKFLKFASENPEAMKQLGEIICDEKSHP